jgi:hypothetical protein
MLLSVKDIFSGLQNGHIILEVIWESSLLLALDLCELCNVYFIVFSYYFYVMKCYLC